MFPLLVALAASSSDACSADECWHRFLVWAKTHDKSYASHAAAQTAKQLLSAKCAGAVAPSVDKESAPPKICNLKARFEAFRDNFNYIHERNINKAASSGYSLNLDQYHDLD